MDSNPDSNRAGLTGQPGTKIQPGENECLVAGQPGKDCLPGKPGNAGQETICEVFKSDFDSYERCQDFDTGLYTEFRAGSI